MKSLSSFIKFFNANIYLILRTHCDIIQIYINPKDQDDSEVVIMAVSYKKLWKLLYGVGALSAAAELFLLFRCGLPWEQLKELMKITAMMLLFGVWLCFLIPRQLPPYYDQNKIDYFTQGPFRIHMPGLSFSNRNWFYISRVLRIFLLAVLVLYPLACCILFFSGGADLWDLLSPILLTAALAGMAAAAYAAARKHR